MCSSTFQRDVLPFDPPQTMADAPRQLKNGNSADRPRSAVGKVSEAIDE